MKDERGSNGMTDRWQEIAARHSRAAPDWEAWRTIPKVFDQQPVPTLLADRAYLLRGREWLQHKPDCDFLKNNWDDTHEYKLTCTCGLDAYLGGEG